MKINLAFEQLLHYYSKINNKKINVKNIRIFKNYILFKKQNLNFNIKHLYTKALAYEEFLKLARLQDESRVVC